MIKIPAIDIMDGKCVRLSKGDFNTKKIYGDPLEMAKEFESKGYEYLHLVDLDGAKVGRPQNLKTLEKISINTKLIIDFGGGIKTKEDAKTIINFGASQLVMGSLILKDKNKFFEISNMVGKNKIIIAADVLNESVVISGWKEKTQINIFDFINEFYNIGFYDFLCTDVEKDGMLGGTNINLYKKILINFPYLILTASGGISCQEDLIELEKIYMPKVVIGKAFYEKKIKL